MAIAAAITVVVALAGAAAFLGRQVSDASGAICGSVWRNRPGHTTVSGGERTADQLRSAVAACQHAAAGSFYAAMLLLGLALLALLTSAVAFTGARRSAGHH